MQSEDKSKEKLFQVTDRRFWVEKEDSADEAAVAGPRYPSFVEELKARTEAAEQKLRQRIEQLNEENAAVRERLRRQSEQGVARARVTLVCDFLEVVDNLERALETATKADGPTQLSQGVELTLSLFLSKLRALGVEPITLDGRPFDPNVAEAIGVVSVSDPSHDNLVIETIEKAYMEGDTLLRPAKVRVGRYG